MLKAVIFIFEIEWRGLKEWCPEKRSYEIQTRSRIISTTFLGCVGILIIDENYYIIIASTSVDAIELYDVTFSSVTVQKKIN